MNIAGKVCESYRVDNAGVVTTFAGWGGICLYYSAEIQAGTCRNKGSYN